MKTGSILRQIGGVLVIWIAVAMYVSACGTATTIFEPISEQLGGDASVQDVSMPETIGEAVSESSTLAKLHEGPLVDFVDPMIATGGLGFGTGSAYPGAAAPFGMVKISPDTGSKEKGLNFNHCAGYSYLSTEIVGFSHIHLHGTGVPDYGNLLLMPVTGSISEERVQEKGYRSAFRHDTEKASPGYYAVTLDRWNIRVELTATTRTAYHRYTYPEDVVEKHVLIRLDHALPGGDVVDAEVQRKSDKELEGWLHAKGGMSGRHGGFQLYFVIRSKVPFQTGMWNDNKLFPDATTQKGPKIGVWLTYPKDTRTVELQTGLSFVSVEGARKNLEAEQKAWEFETTHQATREQWEKLLSVVKVAGGTQTQLRIFYTALYHVLQMPTILMDVDGQYRGLDKQVHKADGFVYYSDFSLWDTYRTLHPLLVLLYPQIQRDMIHSLLAMARDGGELPRWPLATGYTSTMVGASADIVIADSYVKGIRDFPVEEAYQAMRRLAMGPPPPGSRFGGRSHILEYIQYGYVPADKSSGSASVTMEYAYNDFAIAQLAKSLKKTEDETLFMQRSTSYRHLWDAKTQFFRGKKTDGTWLEDFDPLKWTKDYVEGTAWQYLFFVPHDVDGLIRLFGNKETTYQKLEEFFLKAEKEQQEENPINLRSYYWHSNEPDLHAASLFTLLDRPDQTQYWTRWIMRTQYKDTPDGLAGNDDGGTLSAWYVFNAMGIYPIPGRDIYLLTSPVFTRSVITLPGKTFEIRADDASEKAMYLSPLSFQNKPWSAYQIKHTDWVQDGGLLHVRMKETKP